MVDKNFDWALLPPGTETGVFPAPSGSLATACWGPPDGIPVLMLPGITGSKEDFSLVGPLLGDRGYRVMALDLAGQFASGQAGPDSKGEWSLDLHCQDAQAALQSLRPAHIVGYCYSGVVASRLAVENPELLRSLTLLSSPPAAGDSFRAVRVIGPLSSLITPKMGSAILRGSIRHGLNWMPPKRKQFIKDRLKLTQKRSVDDTMATMMNVPDYEGDLRCSTVPRLVAAGTRDLWSLRTHRAFADRIDADFHGYRCGHSPVESTPEELVGDLLDFFARADSRRPGE